MLKQKQMVYSNLREKAKEKLDEELYEMMGTKYAQQNEIEVKTRPIHVLGAKKQDRGPGNDHRRAEHQHEVHLRPPPLRGLTDPNSRSSGRDLSEVSGPASGADD